MSQTTKKVITIGYNDYLVPEHINSENLIKDLLDLVPCDSDGNPTPADRERWYSVKYINKQSDPNELLVSFEDSKTKEDN